MHKLVILDDDGHTTVVPLLRDEVTIGRERGNTIRLTERNVSRVHARLLKRNGSYIIEDLGSYNGVTLNGERIERHAQLSTGDQLGIGDYDLAFSSDAPTTATTRPSPEPRSEPPPRLVVLGEPAAGAEFTLAKPRLRIGRDEQLDIWVDHKSISHEHAEVQVGDGKVTVFDLDSANGMRVNGVSASRAVLETGDILQLGQVRFRFLPAEGSHSLAPLPEDVAESSHSSGSSHKPVLALSVIGALVLVAAGAVLTTLRQDSNLQPSGPSMEPPRADPVVPREVEGAGAALPNDAATEREDPPVEEPQERERELERARKALARGRFDRAFAIANQLPPDSVLRETPEFGEIRYRYVQSHINEGALAMEEGDPERAREEAALVLELDGITPKQRQEARRLQRRATNAQGRRIVD